MSVHRRKCSGLGYAVLLLEVSVRLFHRHGFCICGWCSAAFLFCTLVNQPESCGTNALNCNHKTSSEWSYPVYWVAFQRQQTKTASQGAEACTGERTLTSGFTGNQSLPEAGFSQEEGPKKGFVMGSRTQGVQEILEKYIQDVLTPQAWARGDETHGTGPFRAVLGSNSFAANPSHGHLTYL